MSLTNEICINYQIRSMTQDGYVQSFTRDTEIFDQAQKMYAEAARSEATLADNYSRWLKWEEHLLFSISYKHFVPEMISTIQYKLFYGKNAARCLSRAWKIKEARSSFGKSMPDRLQTMLRHQIDFLAKNFPDCEYVFFSNLKGSSKIMKQWALNASSATGLNFSVSRTKVLVCPDADNQSCWQWICWAPMTAETNSVFQLIQNMDG